MSRFVLLLLLLSVLSVSCNKEAERGDVFECFVDGQKHRFVNLQAYATYDASGGAYSIYGTDVVENATDPETIYLTLNADLGPGTYTLGRGKDGNGYYTDQNANFAYYTVVKDGSGTLEITSKSETTVKGTFSFIAIDPDTDESVEVTKGSFDVSFR